MQGTQLSVSALNEYVRRSLAGDPMLHNVYLRGEISNFKQHVSGHWYFSLKDESARIACVLFRQHNLSVKFVPKDGVQVVLFGSVGLYTASGSYQFYGEGMRRDGVGELYERFLQLKEALTKEGVFDPARKRPLPLYPRKIGVITSQTGAVLHDILTVTRRRNPGITLLLRPAQVQGDGAAEDLTRALQEMQEVPSVDVIIIGRGGGSMEDLWAFNEETLVRAVAECKLPVISAVGHETDFTLCDFAADVRAATPSAAAELAVPDTWQLKEKLKGLQSALTVTTATRIQGKQNRLLDVEKRLKMMDPRLRVEGLLHEIKHLQLRLQVCAKGRLETLKNRLETEGLRLNNISPQHTLRRGYALVMDGERIVKSVSEVSSSMQLLFHDGQITVNNQETR